MLDPHVIDPGGPVPPMHFSEDPTAPPQTFWTGTLRMIFKGANGGAISMGLKDVKSKVGGQQDLEHVSNVLDLASERKKRGNEGELEPSRLDAGCAEIAKSVRSAPESEDVGQVEACSKTLEEKCAALRVRAKIMEDRLSPRQLGIFETMRSVTEELEAIMDTHDGALDLLTVKSGLEREVIARFQDANQSYLKLNQGVREHLQELGQLRTDIERLESQISRFEPQ